MSDNIPRKRQKRRSCYHPTDPPNTISRQLYFAERGCPRDTHQDGMCGCPEFWGLVSTPHTSETPSSQAQESESEEKLKPNEVQFIGQNQDVGEFKEMCFFWYHKSCTRGDRCTRAHEFHVTWPMGIPPGYVHKRPCFLPYCPLRLREQLAEWEKQQEQQSVDQLGNGLMNMMGRSDEPSLRCGSEEGEIVEQPVLRPCRWDDCPNLPEGVSCPHLAQDQ